MNLLVARGLVLGLSRKIGASGWLLLFSGLLKGLSREDVGNFMPCFPT